jgi:hypothetical protein
VIFADGDRKNFALDNLILISNKELGVMGKNKFFFTDKDLTKIGKAIADLLLITHEREREIGLRKPNPVKKSKKRREGCAR